MSKIVQINPATLEKVGEVECTNIDKLSDMFKAAHKAQKIWGKMSFKERGVKVQKIIDYLYKIRERAAKLITKCNGKTIGESYLMEILPGVGASWYIRNAKRVLGPKKLTTSSLLMVNKVSYRTHQPVGVVAIVSPWNYPFSIPFGEVIMGLMAGNAIFLKVSSNVVMIGELIKEIVDKGDLPPGLFHHLVGSGSKITNAMFKNKINKIFFTGSVPVGKMLMEQASKTLTPLSLELGGNDPMIVLNDADIDRAVNGVVFGGAGNMGQTCAGVERVYVQSGIYDKFLKMLKRKVNKMKHGVPCEKYLVDFGSMTTEKQLNIVKLHLKDALEKGAEKVAQSKPKNTNKKGYFHPVTVLTKVNHKMLTMKFETFGPLIPVMKFETIDEVVGYANDSDLCLTASVWTSNSKVGWDLARRIDGGVVVVNDHMYTHALPETEWGAWKESGLGRTHGDGGLKEMCNAKVINYDIMPSFMNKKDIWWHPLNKDVTKTLDEAISFMYYSNPFRKVYHLMKLTPFMINKMSSPGFKTVLKSSAIVGISAAAVAIGYLAYTYFSK